MGFLTPAWVPSPDLRNACPREGIGSPVWSQTFQPQLSCRVKLTLSLFLELSPAQELVRGSGESPAFSSPCGLPEIWGKGWGGDGREGEDAWSCSC